MTLKKALLAVRAMDALNGPSYSDDETLLAAHRDIQKRYTRYRSEVGFSGAADLARAEWLIEYLKR